MSRPDPFRANFRGLQDLIDGLDRYRTPIPDHVRAVDTAIAGVVGTAWIGDGGEGFEGRWWHRDTQPAIENYARLLGDLRDIIQTLLNEEIGSVDDVIASLPAAEATGLAFTEALDLVSDPVNDAQKIALVELQRACGDAYNRCIAARQEAIIRMTSLRNAIHPGFNPTDPGDLSGMVSITSGFGTIPLGLLQEVMPEKYLRMFKRVGIGIGAVAGVVSFGLDFWDDYSKSGDFWGAMAKQGAKDLGGAVIVTAVGIIVPFPADIVACDIAGHVWDDVFQEDWSEDINKYGVFAPLVGYGNIQWKAAGQVLDDGAGVVGNAWKFCRLPPVDLTRLVPDIKVPSFSLPSVSIEAPSIGWPW
jgi:hypothetical protein